MRLIRVKIFGFKTFAEKTEITFDGDLVSIVGSNGCGKSNIVDAIMWGLGETNARHLRAQTNKEIIFAGSPFRKQLGYAEVTLVFDNEDGSLPIDSAEVAITRRVSRSGDSDYEINGRSCRLRDITELLADSGLGKAGYSIVTQQEIDQALAASPQQRRSWVDEASGVQRYGLKRAEAMRRLSATNNHLSRTNDVINELQRQVGPLAKDAEIAREYRSVLSTLRELESGLLCIELHRFDTDLKGLTERIEAAQQLIDKESELAFSFEAKREQMSKSKQECEARLESLRDQLEASRESVQQCRHEIRVIENQLEALDRLEKDFAENADEHSSRISQLEKDLAEAKIDLERAEKSHQRFELENQTTHERAKKISRELEEVEQQLAKARQSAEQAKQAAYEHAHRQKRLEQIEQELQGAEADLPSLGEAVAEAQSRLDVFEKAAAGRQARYQEAQANLSQLDQKREEIASRGRELLSKISSCEARREALASTIDALDGLAAGTKTVLKAADEGALKHDYLPVGKAVHASKKFGLAIETALGGAVNDLIVENEQAAKDAIELLKRDKGGRATFQPLNLVRSKHRQSQREKPKQAGILGWADEFIECEEQHRVVIENLLGRVLIAESVDAALAAARTQGWQRIVSLDGEVVHASGAVSGGTNRHHSAGIVQRTAEIESLEDSIKEMTGLLERVRGEEQEISKSRESLVLELNAAQEVDPEEVSEHQDAKEWLVQLKSELAGTTQAIDKLKQEQTSLKAITAREIEAPKNLEQLQEKRDVLIRALATHSTNTERRIENLKEGKRILAEATRRVDEYSKRLEAANEASTGRAKKLNEIEPERERLAVELKQQNESIARLSALVDESSVKFEQAKQERETLAKELESLISTAHDSELAMRKASEALRDLEIKRARAETNFAATAERLMEEYSTTVEEAVAMAPSLSIPEDSKTLVPSLRKRLKAMGEVNTGAVEAYDRVTERLTELTAQKQDIEEGIAEIMAGIKELDALTKERFESTFAELQTAFGKTFQKFFGGGEAFLELLPAESHLEAGIEIKVQLPGKKAQRLELLSGGERALSALAFLFALLMVRPSPLVILDEVDAPLDGRNVERFVSNLREMTDKSQFVLVTHNSVTIASSDVWLGVTMQEPGVSTIVPLKMPVTDKGEPHAFVG